tara:strand:+ start:5901 stop:6227 length:327 start_codon:yes stop_codon:yes gene_type:complete
MTTNATSGDYLEMKKRRALNDEFFPNRASSTYLANKQYTTVMFTASVDEDQLIQLPQRYDVKMVYGSTLATYDTGLSREKELFPISRKAVSRYEKEKNPNYLKYGIQK